MQSLCFVVLASCLGQTGYQIGRPGSAIGPPSNATRAVFEETQGSSSRNSARRDSAAQDADLRWQRRDGGFDTARNSSGVSAAAYQENVPRVARPVPVLWVSWTLVGAQSPAALLVLQGGTDAAAEELRGVPVSLTEVLSRSGGRQEPVAAYWQVVHRVTALGARRREFQAMLDVGKAQKLDDASWEAALTRVEAQYLEAKHDLVQSQDRLRRMLGTDELPLPSDPFWTGEYDTGLSKRKADEIPADVRIAGQQIELQHAIAQKWATTADLQFRANNTPQLPLGVWMAGFEQWREARGKAIETTLTYNLAIARYAHQVGNGDSTRLARMMLPRDSREPNIARETSAELK
jgi:hypothetical protein